MSVLVIDAGTSSVRALVVRADGSIAHEQHRRLPPTTPGPGLVELDAAALAAGATRLAREAIAVAGPVAGVGIAVQRASTVVWDADTSAPVGPGIGWQDQRTVDRCQELRASGIGVAPNMTATKAEWLLARAAEAGHALDRLRVGTIDSWLAWHLTAGRSHVTDPTNAMVTGLADAAVTGWQTDVLDALGIPAGAMARIVDTAGRLGETSLPGSPPLAALVGDQQASLVGQGCVVPGATKVTFGTGAMLDVCTGTEPPGPATAGSFPVVGWRLAGVDTWARESVILTAGACIDWLCDLSVLADPAESGPLAASVADTEGVAFVPALTGLGAPHWDHRAAGALLGVTRGTTRAHVVRAVLEGIALRTAQLVDAVELDLRQRIEVLHVDGGMVANGALCQLLADATTRPILSAGSIEATAFGAALLAGVAVGTWPDVAAAATLAAPTTPFLPTGVLDRGRFDEACRRAGRWWPRPD